MLDSNLLFSLLSRTHEMFFNQLADQIFLFSTVIFNFALSWVSQLHSQVAIFVLINRINVSYTGSYAYSQLICLGRYVIKMLIQCSGSSVSCKNFVAANPSPNQLVKFKMLLFIQQEKKIVLMSVDIFNRSFLIFIIKQVEKYFSIQKQNVSHLQIIYSQFNFVDVS